MSDEQSLRTLLRSMFDAAVSVAQPEHCLIPHLPKPEADGRIVLLAAGKGAGAMLEVAEKYYREEMGLGADRLLGFGVTRHGYSRPTGTLELVEAGHPVPDQAGVDATLRTLEVVEQARSNDHVVVLLTGGGSANWIAPADGVSLQDKQSVTKALLKSGATIQDINIVRKHISKIKGGRLAGRLTSGWMTTLAISDVPNDDPAAIASGPTVPDPSTLQDALDICARFDLDLPVSVKQALQDPSNESVKPGDPVFDRTSYKIVALPQASLEAAADVARSAGYEPVILGDSLEGEAREVAAAHAKMALDMQRDGRKVVLLSGGELTVTIAGDGDGGPNQEYALGLAVALGGAKGIAALGADTDGTDGGKGLDSDPAGAFVLPSTTPRSDEIGLDAASFLMRNDSSGFFNKLGDLLRCGPTYTNVNDFRAIVVDNPNAS
ncbi:MAG: glycerate kinase [Rhodobacteraceae bacterium]|nr:glycerate kinase [Paracoccaceae bacterium]